MKYQQLLSRIGVVMDRLEKMGFSECPESSIVFKKDTISILFLASKFIIYKSESIDSMFTSERCRRYYDIDDNFEQELFDKLKELL